MSRHFDTINSNQYQAHLHGELEPDQTIVRGNYKRHGEQTRMGAKNQAIDKMREDMGQEEMTRREIEFLQSKKIKEDF